MGPCGPRRGQCQTSKIRIAWDPYLRTGEFTHGRCGQKRMTGGPVRVYLLRSQIPAKSDQTMFKPRERQFIESRPRTSRRVRPATRVFVWHSEDGTRADLESWLQRWRDAGWQVEHCRPRVIEGPAFGALVVLRRRSDDEHGPRRRAIGPPRSDQREKRRYRSHPTKAPPTTNVLTS